MYKRKKKKGKELLKRIILLLSLYDVLCERQHIIPLACIFLAESELTSFINLLAGKNEARVLINKKQTNSY